MTARRGAMRGVVRAAVAGTAAVAALAVAPAAVGAMSPWGVPVAEAAPAGTSVGPPGPGEQDGGVVPIDAPSISSGDARVRVDQDSGTVHVPFGVLGRPAALQLAGEGQQRIVTLPVPDGMTAQALTGTLTVPADLGRGWLEITVNGRLLQRIPIEAGAVEAGLPVSIALDQVSVADHSVTVGIVAHSIPVDDRCYDRSNLAGFALTDAAVDYSGTEAVPTDAAAYFPPILTDLTVFIPEDASDAIRSAALRLTTGVTYRYGAQPVAVSVRALPADGTIPAPRGVFSRAVVLRHAENPALALASGAGGDADGGAGYAMPVLVVEGSDDQIIARTSLILSGFGADGSGTGGSGAEEGPSAAAEADGAGVGLAPTLVGDVASLGELGVAPLSASGLQHFAVRIPVSQSQWGRALGHVSADIHGGYVPLPRSRSGRISVSLDGRELAAQNMDESGRFRLRFDVPQGLMSRDMTFVVAADVTGDFQCGISDASSLTVDADSAVSVDDDGAPRPAGFGSLPQALLPSVDVALTPESLPDMQRAAGLLAGLQRFSRQPLSPTVRPLDDVLAGRNPAVIIAPTGELPSSVRLPVATVDPTVLRVHGLAEDGRYGALQLAKDHGRAVLVASANGEPQDLDRLLLWFGEHNVTGVSGRAVVAPRGAPPFQIGAQASVPVAPQREEAGLSAGAIAWISGGTILVFVAAVAGVLWFRRRRE